MRKNEETISNHQNTIREIMTVISDLQDTLGYLHAEVMDLPFSDFQEMLLSCVEKSLFWERADDLIVMREKLLFIVSMVGQDNLNKKIREKLNDVYEAIDKTLVCINPQY